MSDHLFTLRVGLTNKAHGNASVAIHAYDANHTDRQTGHMRIDATLILYETVNGKRKARVIFPRGATYCAVSRWTAIDSEAAKSLVMSLFAMKPGDTDSEYFDSYTPEQLDFAKTYGETLSYIREDRYGED